MKRLQPVLGPTRGELEAREELEGGGTPGRDSVAADKEASRGRDRLSSGMEGGVSGGAVSTS